MNVKKCTCLLLAFLLLVSNVGLAFKVHYCGGEIASVQSIYSREKACEMAIPVTKTCCAKNFVPVHKKCCSDKLVDLRHKTCDSTLKVFAFQIDAQYVINEWKPLFFAPTRFLQDRQTTAYSCDAHAPPLFKLYSQYIFYA